MHKNIRIENPVSECRFTSENRAKRFVAQGRAEWVELSVSIRFIQSDHRHGSAQDDWYRAERELRSRRSPAGPSCLL